MKYTKEYCKENRIAIHVIEISQLKKVEELFDSNIQAKVNILGVDITGEFLDKIIAKF